MRVIFVEPNFLKNQRQFPLEELARHRGNYIAWSKDGRRIVASAPDLESLDHLVRAAGEDLQSCVIDSVPECDAVIGGMLFGSEHPCDSPIARS